MKQNSNNKPKEVTREVTQEKFDNLSFPEKLINLYQKDLKDTYDYMSSTEKQDRWIDVLRGSVSMLSSSVTTIGLVDLLNNGDGSNLALGIFMVAGSMFINKYLNTVAKEADVFADNHARSVINNISDKAHAANLFDYSDYVTKDEAKIGLMDMEIIENKIDATPNDYDFENYTKIK